MKTYFDQQFPRHRGSNLVTRLITNIRYLVLASAAIALLSVNGSVLAQVVEPVPFARPNVISFHLHSEILDQPMLVEVMLPLSYGADPSRSYPTLYSTDGLTTFPLIATGNLMQSLSYAPPVTETITVGIDFIEIDEVRDFKRLEYFTPVPGDDEDFGWVGGQADQYIRFMVDELKPFIQATFAVDTDREVFGGHSMGGLLSLYLLFTEASAFDGYISASPAIYWADEAIFDFAQDYLSNDVSTRKVLFMSVGTAEDPNGVVLDYVSRMASTISHQRPRSLRFKMKRFRGENHTSVIGPAFTKGSRFVFRKLQ